MEGEKKKGDDEIAATEGKHSLLKDDSEQKVDDADTGDGRTNNRESSQQEISNADESTTPASIDPVNL